MFCPLLFQDSDSEQVQRKPAKRSRKSKPSSRKVGSVLDEIISSELGVESDRDSQSSDSEWLPTGK